MPMQAAYYTGSGNFSIENVEPVPPRVNEVQIAIAYCGICGTDLHVYLGHMEERIGNHRVIGHEMSGTVTAIGADVTVVGVGDQVVVRPLDHCDECPACQRGHKHICQNLKFLGLDTDGAFQQRWTVPAHTVHRLPESVSLKHAALIEPAAVACHDVRRANVVAGEDVLVIGGGPIGMLIAMVANHKGANVTVTEINPHRIEIAQKLGLLALDPTATDIEKNLNERTGSKGVDVIFEVSGTQPGVDLMTRVAATQARIVMVAIHAQKPRIDLFQFFWREIELYGARVYEPEDYEEAIELVVSGALDAETLITDIKTLAQLPEAFAELSANPRAMKTLIACDQEVNA